MTEAPLSTLAVYSARPTIRVDTQEFPLVNELLLQLKVTEREGGLSSLEMRVSNIASDPQGGADLAFEDDRILKLGNNLAIYMGSEEAPIELFRGVVTGLEGEFPEEDPPELVVFAEDRFQQSRMSRRTKVHEDVSLADLAENLARDLGLAPVVNGFTENIGTRVQLNESDLAFLRRLLARYDGDLQVVGEEMHVAPRKEVSRGTIALELHSQLRQARAVADVAHQVADVSVAGWDPIQGRRVRGKSSGTNLGPGSGRPGSMLVSDAVVERSHHIGHLAAATEGEAQAIADAAFDRRARRFVSLDGTAEGNPNLRVGSQVSITGLGDRFDNTYYVVYACHRWDLTRGYETDFEAESAYLGRG